MNYRLILLGAPGAGKGTQAELLSDKLGIPIISTGNILKQAVRDNTPLGLEAATYMKEGKLVPDTVIFGILRQRLASPDCENGYILDGVPRTLNQAQEMEKMGVEISHVVSIEVPDEKITERMTGRVMCEKCSATYHLVTKKPMVDGVCDRCGGKLIRRNDDEPETVKARLVTYHSVTEPLKEFYSEKGILTCIDGDQSVNNCNFAILKTLGVC